MKNSKITLSVVLFLPFCSLAQKTTLQVDLNIADRRTSEVNEKNYVPWPVKRGKSSKQVINGLNIEFTVIGDGELTGTYYKRSVQLPYYARLAGDGMVVMSKNRNSTLQMSITGLSQGVHTINTFHNQLDAAPHANPMEISIPGQNQRIIVQPSQRVLENSKLSSAFLTFKADKNKPAIIIFKSNGDPANGQIVLNGFEIDGADFSKTAKKPIPVNWDEHVNIDEGALSFEWLPAAGAQASEVYVGEDSSGVAQATKRSAYYKGETKSAAWRADDLKGNTRYYWRVDQCYADKVVPGKVWYMKTRQLAFPGAEGYGRFAIGGRAGMVVEVSNLNDGGPGSLREALTMNIGPRTVIFSVSGEIKLKSRLVSNQPYVTIAGQTAPGKGICITGAPLGIVGDDNIARFLRVRVGGGPTYDGMGLTGADHSIIDHCSISWSIDEAFSSRGAKNITLQKTLISEALNQAGHDKKPAGNRHGFAATIGGDRGSFHHNLLAHNEGRNWSLGGGLDADGFYSGEMDITNNVVYNWGGRTTDGGTKKVNFVNNYYKTGPATRHFFAFTADHEGVGKGQQQCYMSGNIMPGRFDEDSQEKGRRVVHSNGDTSSYPSFVDKPFFPSYVTTTPAVMAYKEVLSDVGCNYTVLDEHDKRVIRETLDGTFTYKGSKSGYPGLIDHQQDTRGLESYPEEHRARDFDTDKDGLPDWWEKLKGFDPMANNDGALDPDSDGYTNLEDYLNWLADPHIMIGGKRSSPIDLKPFAAGFSDERKYKIKSSSNGTADINKDGIVTFSANKAGFADFVFLVSDDGKGEMERKVNLYFH